MKEKVTIKELRSFGLLVGGVFGVISVWPAAFRGEPVRLWMFSIAVVLVSLALVAPKLLETAYRGWMFAGHVLGWVNTRLILGALYYMIFMPTGIVLRLVFRDPMCRKLDPGTGSYRIPRAPRESSHLERQF